MNHQEALTSYLAAFVAELVKTGIKEVVISPGSRSTPMALVMAEHPELKIHIHVDERSAAFFALGLAKGSGKPVTILCTSGTAAANYFPAIVEAKYSRIPLLVLTADRPHELRDVGAPQAIDQIDLYGKHVKWFSEMALPEEGSDMIRYARTVCARAVSKATELPAGPVHLNFPFREPLIPKLDKEQLFEMLERPQKYVSISRGRLELSEEEYKEIALVLNSNKKGIIVCGQLEAGSLKTRIESLSRKTGYPILADPLSQLRSSKVSRELLIDTYDAFLRLPEAKSLLKPEVVIRFGAMPVSKALTTFLRENHSARQFVIDGGDGWRDPHSLSTEMIYCDEELFCEGLLPFVESNYDSVYMNEWSDVNHLSKETMISELNRDALTESFVYNQLQELLPEGASIFVGNSMPIRDLDSFFWLNDKNIRVLANRGANGIDGIISSALGASVHAMPMYLVLGDLTFYHDMNGLLPAKLYGLDITIIIINNNGGGIFSFLPQSNDKKNFELLFGTPTGLDFSHAAALYGGAFTRVETLVDFKNAMMKSREVRGLKIIEVMSDRETNTADHRRIWNSVSQEIKKLVDLS
ncbi:2-succinyl-5-enolpyruvyl-6-hydroxy-3-cyclohexene-1-carboxylic-acid synthase [Bacillus sp. EB01]|uniref:2-succinyl-5-enolpyruvyl-6-hydroxy-3- cyclohexene-1-carboxylic-acid synthase n=1 Tax=Bacillus sp. EB01 TaxID=1347086 RepID=UPI0005C5F6FA|nr:2-succinyl-5-enolpyruvyl-6-hydroxy-3-cyclohexene-1-carboxylic-acid synthase [Bacillus sp. EB01]